MIATRNGIIDSIKILLLQKELDINVRTEVGTTALKFACFNFKNNIECLKLLLEDKRVNVDIENNLKEIPLSFAVSYCNHSSNIECVKLLLQYISDVNYNVKNKYSHLWLACYHCTDSSSIECVKLLLQYGANYKFKCKNKLGLEYNWDLTKDIFLPYLFKEKDTVFIDSLPSRIKTDLIVYSKNIVNELQKLKQFDYFSLIIDGLVK